MGLILLEAFGAALVLVLIVWWTMFQGRPRGEPTSEGDADLHDAPLQRPDGATVVDGNADADADRAGPRPR